MAGRRRVRARPMAEWRVDTDTGWLCGARRVPSPNCNERPAGAAVDVLVIHGISLPPGQYGGRFIEDLFTNALDHSAHSYFEQLRGLTVSAHLLIRRDGEVIQFVPFHMRAWHAGESCFDGRHRCNDFSIGVELEGTDTDPYTEDQYRVLAEISWALMTVYPEIVPARIIGHCHIAPARKSDPGQAFDWDRFYTSLATPGSTA